MRDFTHSSILFVWDLQMSFVNCQIPHLAVVSRKDGALAKEIVCSGQTHGVFSLGYEMQTGFVHFENKGGKIRTLVKKHCKKTAIEKRHKIRVNKNPKTLEHFLWEQAFLLIW